ncbi:MAG: substrate-binding domain-containing protein [Planctomycetota bacterium]|nr:substrate-binding domain-containing protein [Planctomycetota bacterium]
MAAFQEETQRVKDHLRAAILRAELPEGTPLHESEIRAETGASVRAVKLALQELAREGLLRRKRNAGTRVAEKLPSVICAVLPPVRSVAVMSSLDERPFQQQPYLLKILSGLREKLSPPAQFTMVLNPVEKQKSLDDLPSFNVEALKRSVQGVISVELSNVQGLNQVIQAGLPVVAIDYASPEALFDIACVDHAHAGFLITHHLVEMGHRKIAFLGELPSRHSTDPTWQERHTGYLRAMAAVGGESPRSWNLCGMRSAGHLRERMPEFHRTHQPTAYVAADGTLAMEAAGILEGLGVSVPREVSVASMDNAVPSWGKLRLTRIFVEYEDLGRLALRVLASRLACRPMPPMRAVLQGRVTAGDTALPPPEA